MIAAHLFVSALLALQASAGMLGRRGFLAPRQTNPSVPSQCTTSCAVLNTIDDCADPACICTNANDDALAVCVDCIINVDPSAAAISSGQGVLDQFVAECFAGGFTVASEQASAASTAPATGVSITSIASTTSSSAATSTTTSPTVATTTTTSSTTTSSTVATTTTPLVTTTAVPSQTTAVSTTASTTNPLKGMAVRTGAGVTGMLCGVMMVVGAGYVMV